AQGQRLLTLARAYAGSPLTGGATQEVQLWNPRTGQSLMPVLGGSRLGGIVMTATLNQAGDRIAVVVAPAGQGGATSSGRPSGPLWAPAADRQTAPPLVHDRPVKQVEFSPDGEWLLTATDRSQLRLWSTTTGELVRVVTTVEPVVNAFFSADSR